MTDALHNDLASLRLDRRDDPPPRRWPAVVVVLLLVAGVAAFMLRARNAPLEVETGRASVTQHDASSPGMPVLTASGYVVPRRKAVVSSKIQGRLAWLGVEEGSRVRQGEVIARLESADFMAQVQRAKAQIQRAEADLAETRRQLGVADRLSAEQILSDDDRDATRSRVQVADAGLAQARADLAYAMAALDNTEIRAPFSGTVVKKMAEVGESVAPIPPGVNISSSSGAIVALADLETLEVEADVSESNVAKVSSDQPAEVTVEAFPDKRFRAQLRQIIPTADRTKATVQVKVTILDKDIALKPEMSAKVSFLEPGRPVVAGSPDTTPIVSVPSDAVVERAGRQVVFTVVEGRAQEQAVQLGPARQGVTAVRQGLGGGETVVLKPSDTLKDGTPVKEKEI